jgi:hypothetical protein
MANKQLDKIWKMLTRHEKRLREMNVKHLFNKFFKRKFTFETQDRAYNGVSLALCVDTRDPLKQNRVKFFNPVESIPLTGSKLSIADDATTPSAVTKISQLDWAWPVSSMGGFDDCGLTWVPPAGSMLVIAYMHSDPGMVFYLGSTWYRDKGPIMHDNWDYQIPEYYKLSEGHRAGYMVGQNDESQVFPPWNNDNYQGYDIDGIVDQELTPDAFYKTTWPHVYGFTTPEKHRIKMDDGDPKCNRRYKRLEILSSMGHLFLMKDDPYNNCAAWMNPQCGNVYTDVVPQSCSISMTVYGAPPGISGIADPAISNIVTFSVIPQFYCPQGPQDCPNNESPSTTAEQEYLLNDLNFCPSRTPYPSVSLPDIPDCLDGIIDGLTDICFNFNNTPNNKYQKHRQECFPYLASDCALNQSGIQIRSRSGATWVADDSVEEPRGRPQWEVAQQPFDMDGCTGLFRGRTYWKSATGHYIEMADLENQPQLRSVRNGINLVTACGNSICMNDETLAGCIAGPSRGIHIRSTANHTLDFCDNTNQQCSDPRVGCAKTGAYAKKAFIKLRSGYGLSLIMADNNDQQKTDQQYIQLMSPQKDNLTRGPHVLQMQEIADGPGQVFLRSGGDYIVYSYDQFVEVVGEEKDNPSDKLEFISNNKIVSVSNVYYNRCKTCVFWADDYIFLLAGRDIPPDENNVEVGNGQPTIYPVCVAFQAIPEYVSAVTGIKASEHVFASALLEPVDSCEGISSNTGEST